MIPPLNDNHIPQTNLPLSEWWQHQALDSAQECESSKEAYMKKYEGNARKALKRQAIRMA
jgi:hypothetical protein